MSSSLLRVLVVGYGATGSTILRALSAPQYKDRIAASVLVRPSSISSTDAKKSATLSELRRLGVDIVPGDIEGDAESLTATLRGFHTIIATVSGGQLPLQLGLIKAAVAAGVKHFFPSEFGFDVGAVGRHSALPALDHKIDVRAATIESGLDYTFIATGPLAEYLLTPLMGVNIAAGTLSVPGSLDNRITITTLSDFGALTAAAVLSPAARNQTIRIASDTLTFRELGATIEAATNKPLKYAVQSVSDLEAALKANPQNIAARFMLVMAGQKGTDWDKNTAWNAVHVPEYRVTNAAEAVRAAAAKSA